MFKIAIITTTFISGMLTNPINLDLTKEVGQLNKINKVNYTYSINDIYRNNNIINKFA